MIKKIIIPVMTIFLAGSACSTQKDELPNIVIIYTDDVGYGDLGCYGASSVKTPNIDRLAEEGIRFVNSYACASTCTPSRYALLTGEYHWRKPPGWSVGELKGVSIAPGDAGMLIDPSKPSLASVLKDAGYATGVVGKWHLGLGPAGGPDWNGTIKPGPSEIGFDYSWLIPVTGDRVPCVFVENGRIAGLDPHDPVRVSYNQPVGPDSTIYNPEITPDMIVSYDETPPEKYGGNQTEKLKMYPSFGHDQTIVNGVPRIGYMTGGKSALWKDEDIAETITVKALDFINDNKSRPFFLYFSTHDVHVPRVPGERFAGKSSIGVYGDVIMQMDWCVGKITELLDDLGLSENTLVIFTSDNGPVQDDGYHDGSAEIIGTHSPAGPYKGGKYSAFEAGTKVPLIVRWPGKVRKGVSETPFSQIDILASLAALSGYENPNGLSVDSRNSFPVLTGKEQTGRDIIVQQNMVGVISVIKDNWKYIEPGDGPEFNLYTRPPMPMGNSPEPQLYNIGSDITEEYNLAKENPEKTRELSDILQKIKDRK
ncbi:MAG: arylsulfatase [Bacteroidales bacterium]|nr:arylsulfatase [Bacteroidales bacterium]